MGGLDPAKLLVILVLALVLLGPERLPRAARQIGAFWHDITRMRERLESEVREALPDLDIPAIPRLPRGGVTGYLAGMMSQSASAGYEEAAAGDDDRGSGSVTAVGAEPAGAVPAGLMSRGVPAGWHSWSSYAPGYASSSSLSRLPAGVPEAVMAARLSVELDDPSWN